MLKLLVVLGLCLFANAAPSRLARFERARDRVPGRYIVKLKETTDLDKFFDRFDSRVKTVGIKPQIRHKYDGVFHGFAVGLPNRFFDFETFLRSLDGVEYVEEDGIVHNNGGESNIQNGNPTGMEAIGASWNIDRMDEQNLPLDGLYDVKANAGFGVTVYILSSGIRHSHIEFGERASMHWDFQCANGGEDNRGDGTALASIVGGELYGLAGGVTLKSVRVMDDFGNGLWSDVIAGINAVAMASDKRVGLVAMVGGPSSAVDQAVADALQWGAPIVVPAGDDNADACGYSPAREPTAATISAIDEEDTKISASNTGSCLDYFCPGDNIPVAWKNSDEATSVVAGSKYAAAHAAGAVAINLEDGMTPEDALVLRFSTGVKRKGIGSPDAIGLVSDNKK